MGNAPPGGEIQTAASSSRDPTSRSGGMMPPMNNRLMRPRARRPDAPRIITANAVLSGLSWSAPASNGARLTFYRVYENGSLKTTLSASLTAYPVAPTAGAGYEVSAVNSVGEGKKSRQVVAA